VTDVLRGQADDVEKGSDLSHRGSGENMRAVVNQIASFRINGQPVMFRSKQMVSIKPGDEVVAAGRTKNGTLEALALRNVSTGAVYAPSLTLAYALTGLLTLIGLFTLGGPVPLGFVILPVSGYVWYKNWLAKKARDAVVA